MACRFACRAPTSRDAVRCRWLATSPAIGSRETTSISGGVTPRVAVQHVIASHAVHPVVAIAAVDEIRATQFVRIAIAKEHVVPRLSENGVVAAIPLHKIV